MEQLVSLNKNNKVKGIAIMKRYPEYKDSGVKWIGEIPTHWKKSRFKYESLVPVQYGLNINSDLYVGQGIRFIRTTDITDDGKLIDKGVYLEKESVANIYLTQPNDFLISRSGTLGRTYLHQSGENYTYGAYLVRFNFGCSIKSRFIFYFTKSDCFEDWIALNTIQSTIGNVNGQKYSNLEIFLPTSAEQTQIANFLDRKTEQIDELIRIKERQIKLLQEQRTALINQAVTKGLDPHVEMKPSGVEWIGELPKHWCKVTVGNLGKVITGYTPPTQNIEYFGNKYPFITPTDIMTDSRIVHTERFLSQEGYEYNKGRLLPPNSVCVTCIASIGKICMTTVASITNQQINSVVVNQDKYNPCFVYYLLKNTTDVIQSVANSATTPIVNKSTFVSINICVPPLTEQTQIANFLDHKTEQIDELITVEHQKIELLQEYRQFLISEAVTGKIDVRNEV